MDLQVIELSGRDIEENLEDLSRILTDSVEGGAAISFMAPLPPDVASRFWLHDVMPEVIAKRRVLFGAVRGGELVGTVQIVTAMPPNQHHRCEVAKMIVHPSARRLGIGRHLMSHAIARAKSLGKTLVTLDTRTGDVAESLYASVGFQVAGVIPDFAWNPNGQARHSTTYMFRQLLPISSF